MADPQQSPLDVKTLNQGEPVFVRSILRSYSADIEVVAPELNVVWVREKATYERKLLLIGEDCLYRMWPDEHDDARAPTISYQPPAMRLYS
ncbi:hypothetical protein [Paenarthrobacter nitroguajacolicus]|uniref:hypothetical protein n=1 Tax=Paenarthrobacter nitroguajacolicus TaxID=211146 RepID=UPI0028581362|nr:hypothetical protein [Paenarthrobacter nitroguajacolicus]MDR6637015.1 hypothetical protein [Paenarthrobacter nitroguajacolicus]